MSSRQDWAKIPPLLFGRITRVLFGTGTLGVAGFLGIDTTGVMGASILGFLGMSFLVGGLLGNPGCEITAIANAFLPRAKRMHFM